MAKKKDAPDAIDPVPDAAPTPPVADVGASDAVSDAPVFAGASTVSDAPVSDAELPVGDAAPDAPTAPDIDFRAVLVAITQTDRCGCSGMHDDLHMPVCGKTLARRALGLT